MSRQVWFRTVGSALITVPCHEVSTELSMPLRLDRFYPGTEGGRWLDNVAIAHLYDALAGCGRFGIVSDHNDGLIETVI